MRRLRQQTLWLVAASVFVPLLVLLGLQLRSLSTLERTWTLAHRTSIEGFLSAVAELTEQHFGALGERLLAVPPDAFRDGAAAIAASHFQSQSLAGVQTPFIYVFKEGGDALFDFDQALGVMQPAGASDRTMAIKVAARKWSIFNSKVIPIEASSVSVDERDPALRMLLYPVTDRTSRVVGVAGAILDGANFRAEVLGKLVRQALAAHFADDVRPNLIVTVRDAARQLQFSTDDVAGQADEVAGPFSFAFKDWRVAVRSRDYTPEQFARSSFTVNVALSATLSAVLVAGLLLTLRAASRELKLSQMKSDFVSNVSHELKTPLASIRLFGELMRLGRVTTPEKVKEYGELIDTESRRLSQLIANILDFSRIESDKKTYSFQPVDLGRLASEVIQTFGVLAEHQGFELKLTLQRPLPSVAGDEAALAQALHNLVDNAIKYSPNRKEVQVSVRAEGERVILSVKDQGLGISAEEQRKIFERFHRVSTGLVHDVRGAGLGLAIVKHVVDAHQGEIKVDSALGLGSCFSISLEAQEPS